MYSTAPIGACGVPVSWTATSAANRRVDVRTSRDTTDRVRASAVIGMESEQSSMRVWTSNKYAHYGPRCRDVGVDGHTSVSVLSDAPRDAGWSEGVSAASGP